MSTLPDDLNPGALLSRELPDDTTVAQAMMVFIHSLAFKALQGMSRYPDRMRVRVMVDDEEAKPEMTMGEIRALAQDGRVTIGIDDGDGGMPAAQEPELVR